MHINSLRYFESISHLKSFRQAAIENQVSQSALSQQIKNLEEDLGVPLFHRDRGGARLTSEGSHLLPLAKTLLENERALRREADSLQRLQTGRVRLGVVPLASHLWMKEVASRFRQEYPGVSLEVTEKGSHEIAGSVLRGSLDIGVIGRIRGFAPQDPLSHKSLLFETLVVCMPLNHPLGTSIRVDPKLIATEPLIMYGKSFVLYDVMRRVFEDSTLNIAYFTNNTETAIRMVSAGIGLAIVPSCMMLKFDTTEVQFVPLDCGLTMSLDAVWNGTTTPSLAAEALLSILQTVQKQHKIAAMA